MIFTTFNLMCVINKTQSQLLASDNCNKPNLVNVSSEGYGKFIGIYWSYGLSINKLNHIIHGNRRNIGYRYFSWNCDRGILGKNKILDIKLFAAKHKPHFMGISEVDLTRDENNTNDNSTNILSTEQVKEKLKIEGYRIILPHSWQKHNKARIIVDADEEMN